MNSQNDWVQQLAHASGVESILNQPDTAHIFIHQHKVIKSHLIPGILVKTEEKDDHVKINIDIEKNREINQPVHLCFGVIPETGIQKMVVHTNIQENSSVFFLTHCAFPNAVDIQHIMDNTILVGKNARYSYFERHVHGLSGGIRVFPHAKIKLSEGAHFYNRFELIQGRAGFIDIKYEATCETDSILEMITRISGKESDMIQVNEIGHLIGENARGLLSSRIAAIGNAEAKVYNKITASAAYTRGHVDCTEIIKDHGKVKAIPIVEVNHPKAHITHEAALGSVDSKQLQTLMSRGLNENEATDLIIQGLLS